MKRPASARRASLPRLPEYAKSFSKDWERLSRTGRYDMTRAKEAMLLLIADDSPLPPEWLDHPLQGNWLGYRECHIGGDFLLIFKIVDGKVVFSRCGTHSELFD